jgi:SAM-dependent methyltransferase
MDHPRSAPEFEAEKPWALPDKADCAFYHTMTFPDGETVEGQWDLRDIFEQYIGHYELKGKTVLDVGTASGFLAFEAERAGATVTAIDASSADEFDRIQFGKSKFHTDRRAWSDDLNDWLLRLKSGYWYAHNRLESRVETIYMPLNSLPWWDRCFDVVLAGAIVEHLADPITFISNIARVAKEAVIIGFTPMKKSKRWMMEPMNNWSNPAIDHTWWRISRGLYQRTFDNVGFDLEVLPSYAYWEGKDKHKRYTMIARRR